MAIGRWLLVCHRVQRLLCGCVSENLSVALKQRETQRERERIKSVVSITIYLSSFLWTVARLPILTTTMIYLIWSLVGCFSTIQIRAVASWNWPKNKWSTQVRFIRSQCKWWWERTFFHLHCARWTLSLSLSKPHWEGPWELPSE